MRAVCPFTEHSVLVDLACGVGRFSQPLATYVSCIYGVDRDFEMLHLASSRNIPQSSWICGDAVSIPLKDRTADIVLASMLMEHVDKKENLFLEIARILKKPAHLILRTMLPDDIGRTTWYELIPPAAELELARTSSLAEITELVASAGMKIKSVDSYCDEIEGSIAKCLPERLSNKSYEILSLIDDNVLSQAAKRSEVAVRRASFREFMSSSLIVISSD